MNTLAHPAAAFFLCLAACIAPPKREAPAPFPDRLFAMDTAGGTPDLVKELGYVGQSGTYTGTPASLEALKAQIRELETRGMSLCAVYAEARLTRGGLAFKGDFAALLAAVKGHGALIWLYMPGDGFGRSDPAGDAVAAPALRALAEQADREGVKISLYPHRTFWVERIQDAMRVANQVDRPNFGVTFNLCHALAVGDGGKIPELVTMSRPRLMMVTVNGADVQGKNWDRWIRPLGEGDFDLVPLLAQLRREGWAGPVAFQGFGVRGDRRNLLSKTMVAWKRDCAAVNAASAKP